MKFIILFAIFIAAASGREGFGGSEQEWGYTEVRPGAHMFWWLYYTTAAGKATDKPLVLWLQGGPGASSSYGNFEELGPLDSNLNRRNHSWVKDCNLMYVDNPVDTGFSYVESQDLLTTNNREIAQDLLTMIKDFYKQFPKFENTPLYIACESYGGKMVAEFALVLDQAIKNGEIKANFKGIGLGDSWISPIDSVMTWAPYLLSFGMVDQRGYDRIMSYANRVKAAVDEGDWYEATSLWGSTESVVLQQANNVDFYNVLSKISSFGRNVKTGPYLPGQTKDDASLEYIMNNEVREALGIIPSRVHWQMSSGNVFTALHGDFMKPVTHIIEELLTKTNIKVAVFSGQLDLIVDTPGTVKWVENLKWPGKDNWVRATRKPLVKNGIIEGFVKKNGNFGMYWVNRAGHMVPADNPAGMDALLRELTNNFAGK